MDIVKIGKYIAENRKKKNMTQEQLAEKIGVTSKTISRWENGNYMPDISLLKPLSEELGITLNDLLSGEKVEKEKYQEKLEENIINTIDYSNKKVIEKNNSKRLLICSAYLIVFMIALVIIDDGNLLNSLPLSEYGLVFEIDSEKLGLTVDYHITDWYINDDMYVERALVYNSVSIFSLIDNVEYIRNM